MSLNVYVVYITYVGAKAINKRLNSFVHAVRINIKYNTMDTSIQIQDDNAAGFKSRQNASSGLSIL